MIGRRIRLLSLSMLLPIAFSTGVATIGATAVPAYAAAKGNCHAYLSVNAGGRDTWKIAYAGSSSGWSPPGNLSMTLLLTINGVTGGAVHSSKSDATSITSMPPALPWISLSPPTVSLKVTAHGPAGTVSCGA